MADEQIQRTPPLPTPAAPGANGEHHATPVPPPVATPSRTPTPPSAARAPEGSPLADAWRSWGWPVLLVVGLAAVCVLVLRLLGLGPWQIAIIAPLTGLLGAAWVTTALGKGPAAGTATVPAAQADSAGQPSGWLKRLLGSSNQGHAHQTESLREVVETVVFVVVLVLLLKSFAAEAFVIPTGSMAETLWGYQKVVVCPRCGFLFPVNASTEVEQQDDRATAPITGCTCPNCRFHIDCESIPPNSGDRVLVAKSLWETGLMSPQRHDVVVFKYPVEPEKKHVPMNYIKRLIGLGGETIGIYYGKVYVADGVTYPEDAKANPLDLWQRNPYMHEDALKDALKNPKPDGPQFRIIRKKPSKIDALKRPVYDADHPASDLAVPRWAARDNGADWEGDQSHGFRHKPQDGEVTAWLGYRHLLRDHANPELITDFMGYNTWEVSQGGPALPHSLPGQNWVGDLLLDVEVTVDDPGAQGELVLELAKGVDRFQARWDLATGFCTLSRLHDGGRDQVGQSQPTALKGKGTHRVRFANVDERLTVWVDGALPFGDGAVYDAPTTRGPTRNDLQPVSIGVRNAAVNVHHLKLWRDTYYTLSPGQPDARTDSWSDPGAWGELQNLSAKTLYVQPGHYLCLGDNSPESSDSRQWGTVPERLMLGRALAVYYPFYFPFPPLNTPVNRVGTIK